MDAVRMRFRAELRARWRSWLVVSIFVGVFGGAVIAAANGALRADSVLDRANARERPPDVFMIPQFSTSGDLTLLAKLTPANLRALPSVSDAMGAHILETNREIDATVPADDRLGLTLFIPKIVEGRLFDPRRVDEAVVNIVAAERLGLHPGDTYALGFNPKHPAGEFPDLKPDLRTTVRVVGVTASTSDVISIAAPGFVLTPAFYERFEPRLQHYDMTMLYLRSSPDPFESFRQDMSRLTGGERVFYVEGRAGADQARRSFRLQGTSMWILAGFLALVAVLMLGQTIARQVFLESSEYPTLRSLGFSPGGLAALTMARAAVVAIAGAALAVGIGGVASIATPFGLARLVEPNPGVWMPVGSLLVGVGGTVLVVLFLAALPALRAIRASRSPADGQPSGSDRPRAIGELVARLVRRPAAVVGTRMALEPGRGRTAAPVRTTIVGTALGLTALMVALVAAASLHHLTTTPRIYGWNWDLWVNGPAFEDRANRRALEAIPGVSEVSYGTEGGQLVARGVPLDAFVMELGSTVAPPILEGRAPAKRDEIALGRKSLRAIHARLGDSVKLSLQGASDQGNFRIVGITVLPLISDVSALGEGAWISYEGGQTFDRDPIPNDRALIRLAPGADRERVAEQLRTLFPGRDVASAIPPGAVVDFGRVSGMPAALAAVVGLSAAGTLAHGVAASVRRRRRDLAILKTLGFDRGALRSAVAWQSTVTTLLTLAVGVPAGIAAGRWVWTLFANQAGFVAEPRIGGVALLATGAGAVVVANLIAALPARSAARTRPAAILRTE